MENKAKKASNEQKMYLVDYMETNIEFANDRFESVDGAHLRAKKWSDLAATLNGLGGAVKDASKWRKYWADQKSHIKEREVLRRASLQQTGRNGFGRPKEATDFEKRVLQLMAPVVVTGHDSVPEMLNLRKHHEEEMQLEFLPSDTEDNNTEQVLPPAAPQTPPSLPRPQTPPQSSSMLRSSTRKRKRTTKSNSSIEVEYLEIEKKKIKLMEENNRLLREKNELEREKHEAEIKWRDRQYEIDLRLEIMERQATFQSDNYIA